MRVTMEEINRYRQWRKLIEEAPLDSIELYDHGELVPLSKAGIARWEYIGLSNLDFIMAQIFDL